MVRSKPSGKKGFSSRKTITSDLFGGWRYELSDEQLRAIAEAGRIEPTWELRQHLEGGIGLFLGMQQTYAEAPRKDEVMLHLKKLKDCIEVLLAFAKAESPLNQAIRHRTMKAFLGDKRPLGDYVPPFFEGLPETLTTLHKSLEQTTLHEQTIGQDRGGPNKNKPFALLLRLIASTYIEGSLGSKRVKRADLEKFALSVLDVALEGQKRSHFYASDNTLSKRVYEMYLEMRKSYKVTCSPRTEAV